MNAKQKDRLKRLFENATPKEFGEALDSAKHVLIGNPKDEEAALVKEYIESLDLNEKQIIAPAKVKVTAKKFVTVDGIPYNEGQSGEITLKQYNALARFFTKVSALIMLLGLLAGGNAGAQQYTHQPITNAVLHVTWSGGTNNIASNNIVGTNIVTATKLKNFGVQNTFALTGAGTAGCLMVADYSGDGTNYVTSIATNWVAAAGTTPVTQMMFFTNALAGYYRFSLLNSNTIPMTNVDFEKIDPGVKDL